MVSAVSPLPPLFMHTSLHSAMGRPSEALATLSSFPQLPDLASQLELPLTLYRDCQLDKSMQGTWTISSVGRSA